MSNLLSTTEAADRLGVSTSRLRTDNEEESEMTQTISQTPFNRMTIHLEVPGYNDGCWGCETEEGQTRVIAQNYAALAAAYAAAQFPGAAVEVIVQSQPGLQSYADDGADGSFYDEDDPAGPVWAIAEYMSRQWTNEPLWAADFDADAYLEEHGQ